MTWSEALLKKERQKNAELMRENELLRNKINEAINCLNNDDDCYESGDRISLMGDALTILQSNKDIVMPPQDELRENSFMNIPPKTTDK